MSLDTFEMPMIHRVLRRELGRLPALVRGASGDPARAAQIAYHATETLDFLHVHHHGEDELLWPVLKPRVPQAAELIDRLEAQHGDVSSVLADIKLGLPSWSLSADPAVGEQLAGRLESMNSTLVAHLDEEEAHLLPLAAQHVTQQEWNELGKHGFGSVAPKRRLYVLGNILADATPEERSKFMRAVPPPARLMFRLFGQKQYAKEVAKLGA
ncbi:MAG TPA: hemerythrin domain-containing protein [Jatrophihabitans sp.]|jgi:hemerythrin-like domain-containing protein